MQSNDDMQHKSEGVKKGQATGGSVVASVLPDDYTAVDDEVTAHEASNDDVGTTPVPSDSGIPQEFTFFQKKKRVDQTFLVPPVAYAGTAQVKAFSARLDSAAAFNAKTHGHIAELMILMSDMSRTMSADVTIPARKKMRWSKWLFYGCVLGIGLGWFLLFPSGHDLITQVAALLV